MSRTPTPPSSSPLPIPHRTRSRSRSRSPSVNLSSSPNAPVLDFSTSPHSPVDIAVRGGAPGGGNGAGTRHFSGTYLPSDIGNENDQLDGDAQGTLMNGTGGDAGDAGGAGAGGGGGGLGNLADELAEAWDGDEDGEGNEANGGVTAGGGDDGDDTLRGEPADFESSYIDPLQPLGPGPNTDATDGNGLDTVGAAAAKGNIASNPATTALKPNAHSRSESKRSLYDGSDYGQDSDFEDATDLSPALEARMASVDNLVRWSLAESKAGGADRVVERVIEGLRDLGSQSKVETSATRLITAHTAITSHLAHQTRTLQTMTQPLLYSHFPSLSSDAIDDLIPLIDDLIPTLPFPHPQPATAPQLSGLPSSPSPYPRRQSTISATSDAGPSPTLDDGDPDFERLHPVIPPTVTTTNDPVLSLQSLLTQTTDITHALRSISDTIHESRQLTSVASRRLRNVRELVADIRREEEGREEGERWIEKGEWDRRLAAREAGRECRDVVSGFEEVFGMWRKRLFGAAAPMEEGVGEAAA